MATKINSLLQTLPPGGVATQRWLTTQGVDYRLADKYVRSGWLYRVGHGAFAREGTDVDWPGGLHALQQQLHLGIRPGGLNALELRGYSHYVALGFRALLLFGPRHTKLPGWFRERQWSRPIHYRTARLFSDETDTCSRVAVQNFELEVPVLERAALEMMYLVPKHQAYEEAAQVMQLLSSLRPDFVQRCLETCRSIKAKRLFMHTAERFQPGWLSKLDVRNVDFGSGKRTIHAAGRLDPKYNLVIQDEDSH